MSRKDKLIERLLSCPSDFTFDEVVTLLRSFGYSISRAGKTGGSRVAFANDEGDYIRLHKPHPRNILKQYQVDDIITALIGKGVSMKVENYHIKPNNYLHYKDYVGNIEFSEADGVFHGKVAGIKSLISFEGNSVSAIIKDFRHAVDEYLEWCAETGKQPEKPFKGSFNVRIGTDLHRKAALTASVRGISLNTLVEDAIRQTVNV